MSPGGEDQRIESWLKAENSFRQVPDDGEVPDVLETRPGWALLGLCGVGATVVSVPMGIGAILYVIGLSQSVS